jgi:two-component system cell cycle response regulator CpdR
MGQANPFKPAALVVEKDAPERAIAAMVLENKGMRVIECDSAEAALRVLDKVGGRFSLMFIDVKLKGQIDGAELAHFAHDRFPALRVVVTSRRAPKTGLPDGTAFLPQPWQAPDLLREAELSQH